MKAFKLEKLLTLLTRSLLLTPALSIIVAHGESNVDNLSGAAVKEKSLPQAAEKSPSPDDNTIEFNTDVLDVADRNNIDLKRFAHSGYIMPGEYPLTLKVNGQEITDLSVRFTPSPADPDSSVPCLEPEMVKLFGLKPELTDRLTWWQSASEQCLDSKSLPGILAKGDLSHGALDVSIPQAWLEYSAPDWDPPSRWDNGVAGILFDYDINATRTWQHEGGSEADISGNGVAGANLGPWRFRADWQAQHTSHNGQHQTEFTWSRYYLYRALPQLNAKLMLGENDLDSNLFDGFHFSGASLKTDDNMLPPGLQGYAPEVTGVARTNAKVTITQQDRVISQTQVAPGPFRIQNLSSSVSGKLDVTVEEQDGSKQHFQVNTASIPYLTRPGMVRYSLTAGRPTDWQHHIQGDTFTTGEFSWGVTNGWSLIGGLVTMPRYNALAVGIGRDLLQLGAVSLDATQAQARPGKETKNGGSWRLSYSKRFEKIDGQVTFAGYRFSQKNFMSMNEFLTARNSHVDTLSSGHSRELYTVMVSKFFQDLELTMNGDYSHQTYWDRPDNDRWSLSLSKYMDIGTWKNISLSLTAYHSRYDRSNDDGGYLSLSIPWSNGGTLSYNGQAGRSGITHQVGWYNSINADDQYNLLAGVTENKRSELSGYYTHQNDLVRMNLSTSYRGGDYSAVGLSLQGGATATLHGAVLHRETVPGGTRVMLDTNDISHVPVKGQGADLHSNLFGKAVIPDMNSYWRNSIGVDVNALDDDTDVSHPLTQLTLTEGAIGYRKLDVIKGRKMMTLVKMADGSYPPFGTSIMHNGHETGVLDDSGRVWLTGIQPGVEMQLSEEGQPLCQLKLPRHLPADETQLLQLTCQPLTSTE